MEICTQRNTHHTKLIQFFKTWNPHCQPDLIWKRHTSGCIYEKIAREVYWRREDLPWRWVAPSHGLDPRPKKLEQWGSQASTSCILLPDCRRSVTRSLLLYCHAFRVWWTVSSYCENIPTTKQKITYSRTNIGKPQICPQLGLFSCGFFGGKCFNI